MGFGDIHDEKSDAVAILLVQFVKGGSLPPEWRSSVAAENQYHGLSLV
jgi:hypothetical protein